LPAEIWSSIFDHVKSRRQLIQCRLVCKAWDPLAERAMFGQVLFFGNINTLTVFYHHLVRKPFLGRCIKKIHFEGLNLDSLPFHKSFLELAFTPSIKSVQGIDSDESFKIMLDIAQGSADRFKKLAYLSLPPTFHKSIHTELALCFRKTLKELVFMIGFGDESYQSELRSLQPLLNRLDKFESLASLSIELSGEIDSMDIFDDILNRCNHLLKLTIGIDNFRDSAWLGREEMREWMVRNVTKCSNACGLHITFMHNPQIVEYLLYKYPNANKVVLTGHGLEEREEEI
ncbi:hypothetical protein V8B55DRAFT_1292105, partial [Mucor lusitanicus]